MSFYFLTLPSSNKRKDFAIFFKLRKLIQQLTLQRLNKNKILYYKKIFNSLKNGRLPQMDPKITSNAFLLVQCKFFNHLYINFDTKMFDINYPNLRDSKPVQKEKICLPFKLFHAAFNNLQAHGHSGKKYPEKLSTTSILYHI